MDSARPSRDFNPLPPHGGRPVCMMLFTAKKRISIHSLRMEGDASSSDARSRCFISIHSLRMEGDFVTLFYFHLCTSHFNPLPPHGGRRYQDIMYDRNRNISIHSLRMEGDSTKRKQQELDRKISIHSLRMEGDYKIVLNGTYGISISIHSLRMEGDI